MKVLYIGGTGEISYSCVQRGVEHGQQITVFNRGLQSEPLPAGVRRITGDLQDRAVYEQLGDEHFDVVCQFMAFTPAELERDVQVFGRSCAQYVFISSATVYQKPWHGTIVTELTPRGNPCWPYAQDKHNCELLLERLGAADRFPYTIVRPSHTYRRRFPSGVCSGDDLAWRILNGKPVILHGDGTSLWTYTHADDFARAFVELLGNPKAIGQDYHITEHLKAYPWRLIYEEFGRALGRQAQIVNVPTDTLVRYKPELEAHNWGDKAWSLVFDNSKVIAAAGGWQCQVTLAAGARSLAEDFLRRVDRFQSDLQEQQLVERIIAEQSALGAAEL